MGNLNETPLANRYTIGIFGKRNAGKSSLINALTSQNIALTSPIAGTTTDPVYKSMELLPIGPVVFIDTAGLDDEGSLGKQRIEKSYEILRKCQFVLIVVDVEIGVTNFEIEFIDKLLKEKISCACVLNHCDKKYPTEVELKEIKALVKIPVICASAISGMGIESVKKAIIKGAQFEHEEPSLIGDLMNSGDVVVLVTPIDKAAPKGRLILPQQQTIRDIIEHDGIAIVTKEHELKWTLEKINTPPAIVITDSQAFLKVAADTPESVPMTSFSILFARQKADLTEMIKGVKRIEQLKSGDKVLIAEGCTHHRQSDDIGKVKIPRWIKQLSGGDIQFEWASGSHYPQNLSDFAVIVHCGGCMINSKEMQYRVEKARSEGVYITNYGILIAHVMGILPRAVKPFPAAYHTLLNSYE